MAHGNILKDIVLVELSCLPLGNRWSTAWAESKWTVFRKLVFVVRSLTNYFKWIVCIVFLLFQLLWDRPDCRARLYESGAHPGALRAVWSGPFWLHLAGVEIFQPLQSLDRRAGPHWSPERGAVWGHATQHAVLDIMMHCAVTLFHRCIITTIICESCLSCTNIVTLKIFNSPCCSCFTRPFSFTVKFCY